jgi:hypothetical protein
MSAQTVTADRPITIAQPAQVIEEAKEGKSYGKVFKYITGIAGGLFGVPAIFAAFAAIAIFFSPIAIPAIVLPIVLIAGAALTVAAIALLGTSIVAGEVTGKDKSEGPDGPKTALNRAVDSQTTTITRTETEEVEVDASKT